MADKEQTVIQSENVLFFGDDFDWRVVEDRALFVSSGGPFVRISSEDLTNYSEGSLHFEETRDGGKIIVGEDEELVSVSEDDYFYEWELARDSRSLSQFMDNVRKMCQAFDSGIGINIDPMFRGQLAAEVIENAPGVLNAGFVEQSCEIWVEQTTIQTSHYMDALGYFCGLSMDWWTIDVDREHGLVFSAKIKVSRIAEVPFISETVNIEIGEIHDSELYEEQTFDVILSLISEIESDNDSEVVRDTNIRNGQPRIRGTTILCYHVYYVHTERGMSVEDIVEESIPYSDITEEDVRVALEYAEENKQEAEEYVERMNNKNTLRSEAENT